MTKITSTQAVKTATSQVGYKQTGKSNKYGSWIHSHYPSFYNGNKSYCDWCDVFVDYCVLYNTKNAKDAEYILCQPSRSCGAGVKWSYKYYKQHKRTSKTAKYGYQIFFTKDGKQSGLYHTGIVIKTDSKYVWYVAGNESKSVKKHKILRTNKKIYGYGRPRYTNAV